MAVSLDSLLTERFLQFHHLPTLVESKSLSNSMMSYLTVRYSPFRKRLTSYISSDNKG